MPRLTIKRESAEFLFNNAGLSEHGRKILSSPENRNPTFEVIIRKINDRLKLSAQTKKPLKQQQIVGLRTIRERFEALRDNPRALLVFQEGVRRKSLGKSKE